MTAVDFVRETLENYGDPTHLSLSWETLDEIIEEAREIEKKQIMEAVYEGMGTNFDPNMGRAEQYYNKKYPK
jgi:hypothetical protein